MSNLVEQQTLSGPSLKSFWIVWWCYRRPGSAKIIRASRKFYKHEYDLAAAQDFARVRMDDPKVLSGGIHSYNAERVFTINDILRDAA